MGFSSSFYVLWGKIDLKGERVLKISHFSQKKSSSIQQLHSCARWVISLRRQWQCCTAVYLSDSTEVVVFTRTITSWRWWMCSWILRLTGGCPGCSAANDSPPASATAASSCHTELQLNSQSCPAGTGSLIQLEYVATLYNQLVLNLWILVIGMNKCLI